MISEKIIDKIEENCRSCFSGIYSSNYDFNAMAREFVNEVRAIEELERITGLIGTDLGGKSILEIGSGYGILVALGRKKFGAHTWGVEPSDQYSGTYDVSRSILQEMGLDTDIIKKGYGENIPWEDETFDIVYSSNVIEHVRDPAKVFQESVRVTKKGGFIVANIPNYGSWWEGHYGILMPPYSPGWLLKVIVKYLGRDTSFVDTLQLVTYTKLRRWLVPCMDSIEILDWGQNLWVERLKTLSFSEWAQLGKLKRLLKVVHRLKMIDFLIFLGKIFHWETPFLLVIRKK